MPRRFKHKRVWMTTLVACALAFSSPAAAGAQGERYFKDIVDSAYQVGTVALTNSSYVELKKAAILPGDSGDVLYFTLTFVNDGDSDISFSDYWVRAVNGSGSQIVADMLPSDKPKNDIAARSSVDFTFYSLINDYSLLQDVKFRITKWDYSLPDLERVIGDISFPSGDLSYLKPDGYSSSFSIGKVPIHAEVTRVAVNKNDKYYVPQITLELMNQGTVSTALPAYNYALRTASGVLYPLEVTLPDKGALQPKVGKELQLKTSTLPASVDRSGWELVITQAASGIGDTKLGLPIAVMQIPDSGDPANTIGIVLDYVNSSGLYGVGLQQLQRTPWDDMDLLTTELVLTNKSENGLPVPEMRAYYVIDDGVKFEAKPVKIDRQVGLPYAAESRFKIVGKIPYTYQFSDAKLILQEKLADGTYADMAEFQLGNDYSPMPAVAYGGKYNAAGNRGLQYNPRAVHSYGLNQNSQIVEVQVEVGNTDKRSNQIAKLAGYIQAEDGALYPTRVRELKLKLNPNGKALVSFWTKMPNEANTRGMKLVLGDAITDNRLATIDDTKVDGYVDPAVYDLPLENKEPASDLYNIDMYPYTLSVTDITTVLTAKDLRFQYTYNLTKDSYYETVQDGDKLIIQFEDDAGTIEFSDTFFFEKKPDDDDKKVDLGEHIYKVTKTDPDLISNLNNIRTYRLSVYHEFQGQKKLLATQKIDWYTKANETYKPQLPPFTSPDTPPPPVSESDEE